MARLPTLGRLHRKMRGQRQRKRVRLAGQPTRLTGASQAPVNVDGEAGSVARCNLLVHVSRRLSVIARTERMGRAGGLRVVSLGRGRRCADLLHRGGRGEARRACCRRLTRQRSLVGHGGLCGPAGPLGAGPRRAAQRIAPPFLCWDARGPYGLLMMLGRCAELLWAYRGSSGPKLPPASASFDTVQPSILHNAPHCMACTVATTRQHTWRLLALCAHRGQHPLSSLETATLFRVSGASSSTHIPHLPP
jgi:hypothetical protein